MSVTVVSQGLLIKKIFGLVEDSSSNSSSTSSSVIISKSTSKSSSKKSNYNNGGGFCTFKLCPNLENVCPRLGMGSYGSVYKAIDPLVNEPVAVKIILDNEDNSWMQEVNVLQKCIGHPNIIGLRYSAVGPIPNHHSIVMDFAECSFADIRYARDHLDESHLRCIAKQLFMGIQHIHKMGVVHRDIKPANILLDKTGCVRIGDFGMAVILDHPSAMYEDDPDYTVTITYRPIDMLCGAERHGRPVDIWSAGCTLAEIATGHALFNGHTPSQMILDVLFELEPVVGTAPEEVINTKIGYRTLKMPPQDVRPRRRRLSEMPGISKQFSDFIYYILALNPEARPTASAALCHEWMTSGHTASMQGLSRVCRYPKNSSADSDALLLSRIKETITEALTVESSIYSSVSEPLQPSRKRNREDRRCDVCDITDNSNL